MVFASFFICDVLFCESDSSILLSTSEGLDNADTNVMSTNVAKPAKVAIIGASGTYGKGILTRAEEIGVEAVVITRSPHKFKDVKPTTAVVETQLDEEEKSSIYVSMGGQPLRWPQFRVWVFLESW